jgi:hypothetical protein
VLVIAGGGLWVYRTKKEIKAYIFFAFWLVMGLGIHSQLVTLDATVADRWFYFPIVGILGVLGLGLQNIKFKRAWLLGLLLLGVLGMRTIVRISDWKNQLALFGHDSQIRDNFDLENSFANELNKAGRPAEAISHFKKSIALFSHETNLFNLGLSYEVSNEKSLAETYYFKALAAKNMAQVPYPHKHREMLYVRLVGLLRLHDQQKAAEIRSLGLADYPDSKLLIK